MTTTRDPLRTRRALLEAAEHALASHGPQVSLDTVAKAAEVSKGGLLHHFPSREALLRALAEHWTQQYDDAVNRHLETESATPGRWCRAHIRAAFDPEIAQGPWRSLGVQAALLTVPGLIGHFREQGRRWEAEMASDGMHPDRVVLIARALDGDAMTEMFDLPDDEHIRSRRTLRDLLLDLAGENGPLGRASAAGEP